MSDGSRKKSPRAPSLALDDALSRALLIYEKEHRHEISAEVAALDIGYSSANNGAALSALASLRYYGLVERPGEGKLVVAKDIETYKFAPEEKTRKQLLKKWVSAPPIFADLLAKYSSGLPSDAAIKFELIQKGFTPTGADDCLSKFLRSVEFARFYDETIPGEVGAGASDAEVANASSTLPTHAYLTCVGKRCHAYGHMCRVHSRGVLWAVWCKAISPRVAHAV